MNLRLVLGDQLTKTLSSLTDAAPSRDMILMCEVREEATYVRHHKKKIAFIFSAMRHFARDLAASGLSVRYTRYDDPDNSGSLLGEVQRALAACGATRLIVTEPGEYRLARAFADWSAQLGVAVEIRPDDRFLCSQQQFADWASGRHQLRMEYFYREMRKRYGVLMDGDQPAGGKWNYDSDNRKPPDPAVGIPSTYRGAPDPLTREVIQMVAQQFGEHFGELEPFPFAVNREQALEALDRFIRERLKRFGDYQDAMLQGEPWLFHSHLSFYLNIGLLQPLECIERAEAAYRTGEAPLNAAEGFIRQVLGWREFVRGIYWLKMPDYAQANFLNAQRPLPNFYWNAETRMNCLRQCISETRENAYAHHIQRLMVLGNFALLAGIEPQEVNEWYLLVYADAFEWVELPNVSGMILFADGGLHGSKPYAAGGAYINRMSDYCKQCGYKVSKKNGSEACPFNYLYWDFLQRNQDRLQGNPRLSMPYRTLAKMEPEKLQAIAQDSQRFLLALEHNEKV